MSFLDSSRSSGARNKRKLLILTFTRWNEGEIFSWYNRLSGRDARSIQSFQVWKNPGGMGGVPHRFIVLRMCDNSIHRFDRAPARGPDNDVDMVGLLTNSDVQCEDSCTLHIPPKDWAEMEGKAERELDLLLNGQVDIFTVITACYAMSINDSTRNYSLRAHNCFFFSWAILMVVSRHHLPYEIPQYDTIVRLFQSRLERLASFIVEEVIELLPKLVIDAVAVFRSKDDRSSTGMGMLEQTFWLLPMGFIGFCYRQFFTVQLLLGLRRQLKQGVKAQLSEKWQTIHRAVRSMPTLRERVDSCLWLEETKDPVQNALKAEIEKIVWGVILHALAPNLGDTYPTEFSDPRRKFSLTDVWNAGLCGGLFGAKEAVKELEEGISHREAFRRVWFAAGDKALAAARAAADRDIASSDNSDRGEVWDSLWVVWDECWNEIHDIAQPRAVKVVEKVVKELSVTGTDIVFEGMGTSGNKTVEAWVAKTGKKSSRSHKPITYASLQTYMQKTIRESPLAAETVYQSMNSVWSDAHKYLPAHPRQNSVFVS